ncbi:MAG TPA: aminotransferase class IV [Acidimicrobiia bacterium]|nr:aminotransferase class IV [Acidimicrobiia bacterium]
MSTNRMVSINGSLVDAADSGISPFDHGFIVGDGVFETLTTVRGVPFAWTRHYERLTRSAAGLGLAPPPSDDLRSAVDAVREANALAEARIRITVTSGPGPLGSDRGTDGITVVVAATTPTEWPATADVVVVPWTRNERGAMVGLKTISYAENAIALAWAKERGAGEAIFANTQDRLCEGTGTNVYVVRDGRVATPPLSSGCLDGVTRQVLLLIAPDVGVEIEEIDLPIAALADADEAFLSSATRGAQPIAHVDGRPVAAAPGPITEKLIAAYDDLLTRDLDP